MFGLIALALLAAPATGSGEPLDPKDKVVCKRFTETGSLVKGYRVCKTKQEWDRERENIRAGGPGSDSCSARANGGQC